MNKKSSCQVVRCPSALLCQHCVTALQMESEWASQVGDPTHKGMSAGKRGGQPDGPRGREGGRGVRGDQLRSLYITP